MLDQGAWSLTQWFSSKRNYPMVNKMKQHCMRQTQLPRGLRRRSAAARLLELRIRIPSGVWKSVFCECCVLLGGSVCDGPIPHPEESYWVCVCVRHWVWSCTIIYLYTNKYADIGQTKEERHSRIPLIQTKWDGQPPGYEENRDNLIFLWK
jgi:hypothetical protein